MSKIKSKNTKPEQAVRKILTNLDLHYRLHSKNLPGKPDIVIPKKKTAIFINGCFWHQHKGCGRSTIPKTNLDYWKPKLSGNIKKQKEDIQKLEKLGWKIKIVWECEINKDKSLREKLINP